MSEVRAERGERVVEEPLTADESRLHLTVSRRFLTKLEAARDAVSHSHPGASRDEILEASTSCSSAPRSAGGSSRSRGTLRA